MTSAEKFSTAADAQGFFALMAKLRGDEAAAKAHYDLALNYQRDAIRNQEGA